MSSSQQSAAFGAAIEHLRRQLGMTHEQIANAGGPSTTTMTKVEAGGWMPSRVLTTFLKLDRALGIPSGTTRLMWDAAAGPVPGEQGLGEQSDDPTSPYYVALLERLAAGTDEEIAAAKERLAGRSTMEHLIVLLVEGYRAEIRASGEANVWAERMDGRDADWRGMRLAPYRRPKDLHPAPAPDFTRLAADTGEPQPGYDSQVDKERGDQG